MSALPTYQLKSQLGTGDPLRRFYAGVELGLTFTVRVWLQDQARPLRCLFPGVYSRKPGKQRESLLKPVDSPPFCLPYILQQ